MKFAKQVAVIASLLLALAMGAVIWVALGQNWSGVQEARRAELAAFDLLLRSSVQRAASAALAQAEIIAHQPVLIQTVADGDRAAVRPCGDDCPVSSPT
jgi:hypothetical protein